MALQIQNDRNVFIQANDGGTITNACQDFVLLTPKLGMKQLRMHFENFSTKLRECVETMHCMPVREYRERFPSLYQARKQESKENPSPLGALSDATLRFNAMEWRPLENARFNLFGGRTYVLHRQTCREMRGMNAEDQRRIVQHAIRSSDDLDDLFKLHKGSKIALGNLRALLYGATKPLELLEKIASESKLFIDQEVSRRGQREKPLKAGQEWAPVWFGLYLARVGVWLAPREVVFAQGQLFPRRWLPIKIWLTVPEHAHQKFEELTRLKVNSDDYNPMLWLSFASCYSSTMWTVDRFRPWPLIPFKELFQEVKEERSGWGMSLKLYIKLTELFGVEHWGERSEAPYFTTRYRLTSDSHLAFRWVRMPNARNTKKAERCLGRKVTEIPQIIVDWADEFERILPLTDVVDTTLKVSAANIFLIYLMSLPEGEAPKNFRELDRSRHINNFDEASPTLRNFVSRHFAKVQRTSAIECFGVLAEFWQLAAIAGGWASKLTNPVDPKVDRPFKFKSKPPFSNRAAMHPKAWSVIRAVNRKNFYEFARGTGNYTYQVVNPETQSFEEVFWPSEAITIDFILSTGSRNKTGRWLDSGEGDELVADLSIPDMVPNTAPTATAGRSEGVLRVMTVDGKKVLGLYYNHQKTRPGYEFSFIERELAFNLQRMKDLVQYYKPIRRPVVLADRLKLFKSTKKTVKTAYPLTRQPDQPDARAVSAARVSTYWLLLLRYCEPLVKEALGHHYPLVDGSRAIYDIHSIRVTLVTFALEQGHDVETVMEMVGHASSAMTWYYNQRSSTKIHNQMQALFDNAEALIEQAMENDRAAQEAVLAQAYEGEDAQYRIAIDSLRQVWGNAKRSANLTFLQSGICVAGECSKGLAGGEGKRPVFRPRACARCIFRLTGPFFIRGLKNNANQLAWEIRKENERSVEFAKKNAEQEARTGKISHANRKAMDMHRHLRNELYTEWVAEVTTLYGCQAMRDLLPEGDREKQVFVAGEGLVSGSDITLGFSPEANGFELLHELMKDAYVMPATNLQIPAEVPHEWRKHLQAMLRAAKHEDVMFSYSEEDLLATGDLLIDAFPDKQEFQQVVEASLRGERSPALEMLSQAIARQKGQRALPNMETVDAE